ncbi:MAG: hypothetical protein U1F36_07370 [Planctomycetota bacterium]
MIGATPRPRASTLPVWPSPPARLRDPGSGIHLLQADLASAAGRVELYRLMLEERERRRVDLIQHSATREQLTVALGLSRVVLAAHDRDPLADVLTVAHARVEGRAVFAVSRGARVGIELVPSRRGCEGLELGAVAALGHAGCRKVDRAQLSSPNAEEALDRGHAMVLRHRSGAQSWTVQMLAVDRGLRVVLACASARRDLHCWTLQG